MGTALGERRSGGSSRGRRGRVRGGLPGRGAPHRVRSGLPGQGTTRTASGSGCPANRATRTASDVGCPVRATRTASDVGCPVGAPRASWPDAARQEPDSDDDGATAERKVAPSPSNPVMYPLALTFMGPAEAVPTPPGPEMSAVKVARP